MPGAIKVGSRAINSASIKYELVKGHERSKLPLGFVSSEESHKFAGNGPLAGTIVRQRIFAKIAKIEKKLPDSAPSCPKTNNGFDRQVNRGGESESQGFLPCMAV